MEVHNTCQSPKQPISILKTTPCCVNVRLLLLLMMIMIYVAQAVLELLEILSQPSRCLGNTPSCYCELRGKERATSLRVFVLPLNLERRNRNKNFRVNKELKCCWVIITVLYK